MKNLRFLFVLLSILVLAILLGSCAPQATQAPTPLPPTKAPAATSTVMIPVTGSSELKGDMIRGGKLYDGWAVEIGKDPPKEDQPLFKTQTTNKATGANTWKCAECHGWDYKGVDGVYGSGSHMTGFKGVLGAKGKEPAVILATLQGKVNPYHDFSKVMATQDLVDLAFFISKGTMDMDAVLNKDGSPKGVAADGKEKYNQVCGACHGPNGNAINFKTPGSVEYLAHVTNSNPWQALHRTRVGVVEWPMPSAIENKFTDQDLANVLAYARTLPKAGALASGGGLLYDKWNTAIAVTGPTEDQPLWKTQTTNTRKGIATWTCRECHGVDYLGAAGVYASGGHKTGFPGILTAAAKSEEELTAALTGKKNPDHDFSKQMNEAQIKALVQWVKKEMFDMTSLVKSDKVTVAGDIAHGKDLFGQTCEHCHGKDGKLLNFKTPESPEYVGTVAASEPEVCIHRVAFGVPGFPMSAAIDLGLSHKDIVDACAYAQTLPVK